MAKLDAEVKQFEDEHKKCRVIGKGNVKDIEKYAKRIKYYRYDMFMGLEDLEEEVAVDKGGSDPVKANSIDDYAKDKKFRDILKGINWNKAKLVKACAKLDALEKDANLEPTLKKLQALEKKIAADLKQRKAKKEKSESKTAIEDLEKQVKDDVKVLEELIDLFKKNPDVSLVLIQKAYDDKAKAIINVKPRMSATQKKFNAIYPKMLIKIARSKARKACRIAFNEMENEAENVVEFAKEKQIKKLTDSLANGQKHLKIVEKLEEDYSKIKKKYQKEIDTAEDAFRIEKLIDLLADRKNEATKMWNKALADMKKAGG